ncbi:hypothetical protein B0T25DRAFT_60814 [Lasiosphaeria hispida]|uniref:Ankyrin repeat protein n=1 Tax=Lasiosphaeria hispida TaxID=260671 RepID=A0AAJ0HX78_9PEZI|nr:hypothetical protein B0T25DRAFT_60814 [Lasiosphaeria hispida]
MVFSDSGSTLGHLARTSETAQRLADAGFMHYNHRDGSGKHCLFPAVGSLNSGLIGLLLAAGTLTDIQDTKGKTCLHKVVKKIGRGQDPQFAEALAVFDIVRLLLPQPGTRSLASVTDNCHCPCSENGHLASDQLSAELQDSIMFDATSPLWVIEYLTTLEDFGLEEEARQGILAQLRLCKFSKLGIPHRCRCFGKGEEEDRLGDLTWIGDEKKIEKLEAEMTELQQLPLGNLKECFVLRMRESYDTLREQRVTKAEEKEKRRQARQAKQSSINVSSRSVPFPLGNHQTSREKKNPPISLSLPAMERIRQLDTTR